MEKTELYRRTGNERQLFSVRSVRLMEGRAGGCRVVEVTTAGGLQADILPDTGLDIGALRYKGTNISFMSKNGYDSCAAFSPHETEFLNTFPGGMLYTCGLRSVGPANRDGGEWFPLHGRFHGIPATEVCAKVEDDVAVVSGTVTQSALFGHVLRIKRTIRIPVYESRIEIEDTLENLTPSPEEIMLLYHFNFGYPFLSEHARLILPERRTTRPRDENAAGRIGKECEFTEPVDGMPEQVFFHEMEESRARVQNPSLGISAQLTWSGESLPVFAQWKSMASGDYVLGLEPSNCSVMGRHAERENGTLKKIGGFESVHTRLSLELSTDSVR